MIFTTVSSLMCKAATGVVSAAPRNSENISRHGLLAILPREVIPYQRRHGSNSKRSKKDCGWVPKNTVLQLFLSMPANVFWVSREPNGHFADTMLSACQ